MNKESLNMWFYVAMTYCGFSYEDCMDDPEATVVIAKGMMNKG